MTTNNDSVGFKHKGSTNEVGVMENLKTKRVESDGPMFGTKSYTTSTLSIADQDSIPNLWPNFDGKHCATQDMAKDDDNALCDAVICEDNVLPLQMMFVEDPAAGPLCTSSNLTSLETAFNVVSDSLSEHLSSNDTLHQSRSFQPSPISNDSPSSYRRINNKTMDTRVAEYPSHKATSDRRRERVRHTYSRVKEGFITHSFCCDRSYFYY